MIWPIHEMKIITSMRSTAESSAPCSATRASATPRSPRASAPRRPRSGGGCATSSRRACSAPTVRLAEPARLGPRGQRALPGPHDTARRSRRAPISSGSSSRAKRSSNAMPCRASGTICCASRSGTSPITTASSCAGRPRPSQRRQRGEQFRAAPGQVYDRDSGLTFLSGRGGDRDAKRRGGGAAVAAETPGPLPVPGDWRTRNPPAADD